VRVSALRGLVVCNGRIGGSAKVGQVLGQTSLLKAD
jgi:hypothetical protein